MIKGEKIMQVGEILSLTNEGYDIYRYYMGVVRKLGKRPWGLPEAKSSFGVGYNKQSEVWMWADFAKEERGGPIALVQKMFNLTFLEAINKICYDFGWSGENVNPVKVVWEKPNIIVDYCDINFSDKPFDKRHHEFWNIAEVTEDQCNKYNCFAVKDLAINRKKVNIKKGEIVFAYYCPPEESVKIYFPDRDKGDKFRNNVPYNHLWNYENVGQCDHLIIQKSNKDLIVTSMIDECVVATQSESEKIFNDEVRGKISAITENPWIWYGSDEDGVRKCQNITAATGYHYINTPKELLPTVNDNYSFVKMHNLKNPGTGLRELQKFMREKYLI